MLAGLAVVVAGCGGSSKPQPAASPTITTGSPDQLYVSLGDSYAAGFEAYDVKKSRPTTNGFAYQLVDAAKAKGYDFRLVNFACGGATTTSILQQRGCRPGGLGPGGQPYDGTTQVAAATSFIRSHPGKVKLITVSIGGNDITSCADAQDAVKCASDAIGKVRTNLATLLQQVRQAAGPAVPIVGITYPDVLLGDWVTGKPKDRSLAQLSVVAFQSLFNPALKTSYAAVGGQFVDVTAATGAYIPFSQTTSLDQYGTVPVAVAKACQLTYFCQYQDIHARTEGYKIISDLILGVLPSKTG